MFTGLVERVGRVTYIEELKGARCFEIAVEDPEFLRDAIPGESISTDGVCLTATGLSSRSFRVTAVEETLRRTTLGAKTQGARLNLERALLASARLGGHIVQGHVDGVADITGAREEGESVWLTFQPPFELMRYIVEKGSVCLDGISLTVAGVAYNKFSVALIPHTHSMTTAGEWMVGARVNLEVDIVAKYVERLTLWTQGEAQE